MNTRRFSFARLLLWALLMVPALGRAATSAGPESLPIWWALPFAGLLLSIAVLPVLAPAFWHRRAGTVTALWALAFLLPYAVSFGAADAASRVTHTVLAEYLPFVLLMGALYTVAGGIFIRSTLAATAGLNTALLLLGTLLASFMGTTGASMVLIRPLLRANSGRRHSAHVVVFFIFLVSNAGGALTPLGDPPLFLGFLKGIDFFWTARHLWQPMVFLVACLLLVFYLLDRWYFKREPVSTEALPPTARVEQASFGWEGVVNLWLLVAVIGLVFLSGWWKPAAAVDIMGTSLGLAALVRDAGLLAIIGLSLYFTPPAARRGNQFSWTPMREVATLFAGIFLTLVPVMLMLQAGLDGPFGALVSALDTPAGQPDPTMFFWITGVLSAFLDNAPTYLVFFTLAGGEPALLMGPLAPTLAAVSAGAVFMGALTYIGNAPNMLVKAVAEERGVRMPGFFAYMAWSGAVLLPLFLVMTFVWFR